MMWQQLDNTALVAIDYARGQATQRRDFEVGTLHILWGLVHVGDETARLLTRKGVTEEKVIRRMPGFTLELQLVMEPREQRRASMGSVWGQIMYAALEEADAADDPFVRTENLLYGLFYDAEAAQMLAEWGVTHQDARDLSASRIKSEQELLEEKAARMLIRDKEIASKLFGWMQSYSNAHAVDILVECGLDRDEARRKLSLYLHGSGDAD